jgi:crooked neck
MKVPRIKNYAPAEIQVTAEQLLRESIYYRLDEHKPARIKITDPDELEEYKYRLRKDYEDSIHR